MDLILLLLQLESPDDLSPVTSQQLEEIILKLAALVESMSEQELGWGDDFNWITKFDYTQVFQQWMNTNGNWQQM